MLRRPSSWLLRRVGHRIRSWSSTPAESTKPIPTPGRGDHLPSLPAAGASAEAPPVARTLRERLELAAEAYSTQLQEHPVRTNAVTSGIFCIVGDALAQFTEWRLQIMSPDKETYNYGRTARMAVYGTLVCGPLLAVWYRTLHTFGEVFRVSYSPLIADVATAETARGRFLAQIVERVPRLQWMGTLHMESSVSHISDGQLLIAKVLADNILFQGPFLGLYMACVGALEGRRPSAILEKTKESFERAWGLSVLVWAPVQLLNLHYVPLHFQPVLVSAVNVGWKATLSLLEHYQAYGPLHLRKETLTRAQVAELEEMQARLEEVKEHNRALQRAVWLLQREMQIMQAQIPEPARAGRVGPGGALGGGGGGGGEAAGRRGELAGRRQVVTGEEGAPALRVDPSKMPTHPLPPGHPMQPLNPRTLSEDSERGLGRWVASGDLRRMR